MRKERRRRCCGSVTVGRAAGTDPVVVGHGPSPSTNPNPCVQGLLNLHVLTDYSKEVNDCKQRTAAHGTLSQMLGSSMSLVQAFKGLREDEVLQ
ncbi:hypothetical protein Dimus_024273, partial [Dionaea muscipula]